MTLFNKWPAALFCGLLTLPLFAQELDVRIVGDSAMVVYRLEEVVVYGNRQQARSGMVTELTPVDIQRRQGRSVADLLKLETSLNITTGAKAETQTRIRGFNARDVLVLVDGRPINPGYYGKADLNMLPKENIAKIKVVKGPASVAYGANSMGGVVNIITKNGFEKPMTSVTAELGDYATRSLSLNHSGRRGKWFYYLSAYESKSDGWRLSDDFQAGALEDGGLRSGTDYHKAGLSGKLGYMPSSQTVYSLSAGYHWAEKAVPPTTVWYDDPRYRYWPRWERYFANASAEWMLSPLLTLRSTLFADAYHDRLQEFKGAEMDPDALEYDGLLENWTVGGSVESHFRPDVAHHLRSGIQVRRDLMNKQADLGDPWYSRTIVTASVFTEDEYRPWDSGALTAGMAMHGFSAESEAMVWHWAPMVGVEQTFKDRWTLRGGWSNAIRYPTMHHLYSLGSGNAELKSEEADKWEVGVESGWTFDATKSWRMMAEISVYQNYLKNMIYRAGRTDRYSNIVEAELRGVELSAHLKLPPRINVNVQYTWIDPAAASDELMEELPEHRWGVHVWGTGPLGIDYFYDLNYFDDRYSIVSTSSWAPLASYSLHHAGLSRDVGFGITLKLTCKNLTDADYEEEFGYPAPGRQFFVGFTWKR